MRIIKKSPNQILEQYKQISEFEEKHDIRSEIETGLSSIFLISQNLPVKNVSDFFSGENFSVTECAEELETSYELVKYGFYKQSMISLRIGLEIGLLSIYWSIIGKESQEFKEWLSSKRDTPYYNNILKKLKSNPNIADFDNKYDLMNEIKSLWSLSDFVHTKGMRHSNYGDTQRALHGQDSIENFKLWLQYFKQIVKIVIILHTLKFPTLCLRYSTEFLLSKFGIFSKIPMFGAGHGDEMATVLSFVPSDQMQFIEQLSKNDEEVKYITKWLDDLPSLSASEVTTAVIEEQKENIKLSGGFIHWMEHANMQDSRINDEIIDLLRVWAEQNDFMDFKPFSTRN